MVGSCRGRKGADKERAQALAGGGIVTKEEEGGKKSF